MSLGVCIKSPEGVVLAAESRVTFGAKGVPGQPPVSVTYDNATKLLSFSPPHDGYGVVTYGLAGIGLRGAQSLVPEFEAALPREKNEKGEEVVKRLSVPEFAKRFSAYYKKRFDDWQKTLPTPYGGPPMVFIIAGYDDGQAYGRVFEVAIPNSPKPDEKYAAEEFGITWGGQREIADRLIQGFDQRLIPILGKKFSLDATAQQALLQELQSQTQLPMPLQAMPLQDCVDLALLFLETTIEAQRLTIVSRGCGGPIDLAVITRSGLRFVQRKEIHGKQQPDKEV